MRSWSLLALALILCACGGRRRAQIGAEYTERGGQSDVGAAAADPAAPASRPPIRPKAPLPDGWPREPVEPMPLRRAIKTVMDAHDPVARFVTDFQAPGELTIEFSLKKATGFKARVTLHDSFGTTLFEAPLTKSLVIGPRSVIPGTLYLLVQRDGGLAEVRVRARFKAEAYQGVH